MWLAVLSCVNRRISTKYSFVRLCEISFNFWRVRVCEIFREFSLECINKTFSRYSRLCLCKNFLGIFIDVFWRISSKFVGNVSTKFLGIFSVVSRRIFFSPEFFSSVPWRNFLDGSWWMFYEILCYVSEKFASIFSCVLPRIFPKFCHMHLIEFYPNLFLCVLANFL